MKKPLSRREFLRLAATGAGALALNEVLTACGVETTPRDNGVPTTAQKTATTEATVTDEPLPTTQPPQDTATIEVDPTTAP